MLFFCHTKLRCQVYIDTFDQCINIIFMSTYAEPLDVMVNTAHTILKCAWLAVQRDYTRMNET